MLENFTIFPCSELSLTHHQKNSEQGEWWCISFKLIGFVSFQTAEYYIYSNVCWCNFSSSINFFSFYFPFFNLSFSRRFEYHSNISNIIDGRWKPFVIFAFLICIRLFLLLLFFGFLLYGNSDIMEISVFGLQIYV